MNFYILCYFCLCFVNVKSVSFEEDVSITYEQKLAIDKLRQRVKPWVGNEYHILDDIYLVKFLRSTNFDLRRTEKKILENIRWRNETGMATIENQDFSDVATDFPYSSDAFDKDGRPVLIAFAGDWNIRSAVVTGRIKRVLRYLDKGMEMLTRQIRQLQSEGKNVTQAILIIELNQFSLVTHACVQCLVAIVDFLHSYESHFPGLAHKVFFVDAPPTVHFAIELVRQNVSKESRDAITTYGTNKEQWTRVLQKYIDSKYLPVDLGGSLEHR